MTSENPQKEFLFFIYFGRNFCAIFPYLYFIYVVYFMLFYVFYAFPTFIEIFPYILWFFSWSFRPEMLSEFVSWGMNISKL